MTSSGLDSSSKIPARPELNLLFCFCLLYFFGGGLFNTVAGLKRGKLFSSPRDYRWDSLCQVKDILENVGKESNTTKLPHNLQGGVMQKVLACEDSTQEELLLIWGYN